MDIKKIFNAAGIIGFATIICKDILDLSDNLMIIGSVLCLICMSYRIAKWREYNKSDNVCHVALASVFLIYLALHFIFKI